MSHGSLLSESWNALAVPWKLARIAAGKWIFSLACSIRVTASPSALPSGRLNESVTAGNCPWWLTLSGAVETSYLATAPSGTRAPPSGALM